MSGMGELLGANGAAERLKELQARIDGFSPAPTTATPGFSSTLSGAIGNLTPVDPTQSSAQFADLATDVANQNGVDPGIFKSLVTTESAWNPKSLSNKGAIGLTQLMPDTAKGVRWLPILTIRSRTCRGGAKYLRQMLDKFGGNYTKALAAYNARAWRGGKGERRSTLSGNGLIRQANPYAARAKSP